MADCQRSCHGTITQSSTPACAVERSSIFRPFDVAKKANQHHTPHTHLEFLGREMGRQLIHDDVRDGNREMRLCLFLSEFG